MRREQRLPRWREGSTACTGTDSPPPSHTHTHSQTLTHTHNEVFEHDLECELFTLDLPTLSHFHKTFLTHTHTHTPPPSINPYADSVPPHNYTLPLFASVSAFKLNSPAPVSLSLSSPTATRSACFKDEFWSVSDPYAKYTDAHMHTHTHHLSSCLLFPMLRKGEQILSVLQYWMVFRSVLWCLQCPCELAPCPDFNPEVLTVSNKTDFFSTSLVCL